jgi:FixJ family two-component response regulator
MVHGKRVFVVDDDPSARQGLALLLRTAGYDVSAFASADEFVDALGQETSGCLVLDARLPGMSCEELSAKLEERCVDLPIIFVTADDDPETMQRAQRINAAGFFRKPVDGTALFDAIEWALRSNKTSDNHEIR